MPLYEFKCECGNEFEVICQPDKKDTINCSVCDSKQVKEKVSAHKSYQIKGPNYGSTPKRGKL